MGMVVLGGFAGLVFDGGMLYYEKRRMQSAADAGAMGGAWEIVRGHTDYDADIQPAAL
ncbi:MAG TPA: pilus assembly protein TadG-related protein, partial [Terriglobales bacterium]